MREGIAYIHWGNSWQLRSYQDFHHYIDTAIYIHDLPKVDLARFAAVIMPDAMDSEAPRFHAGQLNAYLAGGGFLIVFLQGHADWIDLPGLVWTPGTCRDWLWWTKGETLEIRLNDFVLYVLHLVVVLLTAGPLVLGLLRLKRLFALYGEGIMFGRENVAKIREFRSSLVLFGLTQLAYFPLSSLVAAGNPSGRSINISFSSGAAVGPVPVLCCSGFSFKRPLL